MKHVLIPLALALFFASAPAAPAKPKGDPQSLVILQSLKQTYPGTTFTAVRPTPIKGIFEVQMGRNIAYTDEAGKVFIFGSMYDMQAQKDLTAERRSELGITDPAPAQRQSRAATPSINWSDLPLADAIVRVNGDGSRKLAVFADPDCGFCKRLEVELDKVENATIYTFAYHMLNSNGQKVDSVWCAGDEKARSAAWTQLMAAGKPPAIASCETPSKRNLALAGALGVRGTPTLVAADGRVVAGAQPADRINAFLGGK